jgi:F-type H+-transporting ATPase subunit a
MNVGAMPLPLADGGFSPKGPMIVWSFDIGGYTFAITETIVVQWFVILLLGALFFVLGRNLKVRPEGKRQVIGEMLVTFFTGMVRDNLGEKYIGFTAYIAPLLCFSLLSNLMGMLGLRSPTSDLSMVAAWGIVTFVLVQAVRIKTGGAKGFFGAFVAPMPFMLPFNIVGEISNPVSQTIRHFANILVGSVIMSLIYFATSALLPFGIASIGVPAVLSMYFDIFSAVIQAYVFAMLTIAYVNSAIVE